MFNSFPFMLLSFISLILSSLMAISSSNWLYMWIALEMNLLSFIPMILSSNSFQETEASVKYFLTQALGSSILLMSSMMLWYSNSTPENLMHIMLIFALMLKVGMAPCHLWYPSVMTSVSWSSAMILSTWQKLAPITIMSFIMCNSMSMIFTILAALNAIVGGLMGMNQSHLRTILAYSSITHMGWMLALISLNMSVASIMYFLFYVMVVLPLFVLMLNLSSSSMNNINKFINHSPTSQITIPILLLSLGGLPPLTGFFPKWMAISMLASSSPILILVLIMGSMLNMYYYLNLLFTIFMSSNLNIKQQYKPTSMLNWILVSLAVILLPIMPIIM